MRTSTPLKLFMSATRLLVFSTIIFLAGCKKADMNTQDKKLENTVIKSVAELMFSSSPVADLKITQLSADKKVKRVLVPLENKNNLKVYKYILMEQHTDGNAFVIGKLLSKTKINNKNNLFNLPLASDGSLNYFDANAPQNAVSKILMKAKGTKITSKSVANDLTEGSNSNYVVIVCGDGYCIDHWWITYDENTGEILSVEYIGSDCYETHCSEGGGGGGGTGGSTGGCNLTETEAETLLDLTESQSDEGVISQYTGPISTPDENGIIRVAKTLRGGGFSLDFASNWWVRWGTNFAGVIYNSGLPRSPWKWESVTYTGFTQYEGTLPPCASAEVSANCIPLISSDKISFEQTGTYSIHVKWTCGINFVVRDFYGPLSGSFIAEGPNLGN